MAWYCVMASRRQVNDRIMNNTKYVKKKVALKRENLTFHKLDWLEKVTLVIAIWFVIYPKPYTVLFTLLLLLPVVGLVLNGLNGRPSIASLVAVSKDEHGNDKYDVADFIEIAPWAILVRVLIDYEYESFYSLLIPGTIAFVLMVGVLYATHKFVVQSHKSPGWIYASVIFSICLYSYSATYGVNCVYDKSAPEVFHAKVIDKHISKGRRHTTYYVKVMPWGHHYDPENISVAPSQYNEIQIGQTVKIDLISGLLGIQWYYIDTN